MSETIWVSEAPGHVRNMRPFRHDVYERDPEHMLRVTAKIRNCEPLDDADFPTRIWYTDAKYLGLPNFFKAYGFWVLSAAAAAAIESCGLGRGEIRPVTITRKDRKTPIEGEWHVWSIGNVRPTLVVDQSAGLMVRSAHSWSPPFVLKDDMIAVEPSAIEGPPAWVDPALADCFFVTGTLMKALKAAKATNGFMLRRCRLVDR